MQDVFDRRELCQRFLVVGQARRTIGANVQVFECKDRAIERTQRVVRRDDRREFKD